MNQSGFPKLPHIPSSSSSAGRDPPLFTLVLHQWPVSQVGGPHDEEDRHKGCDGGGGQGFGRGAPSWGRELRIRNGALGDRTTRLELPLDSLPLPSSAQDYKGASPRTVGVMGAELLRTTKPSRLRRAWQVTGFHKSRGLAGNVYVSVTLARSEPV